MAKKKSTKIDLENQIDSLSRTVNRIDLQLEDTETKSNIIGLFFVILVGILIIIFSVHFSSHAPDIVQDAFEPVTGIVEAVSSGGYKVLIKGESYHFCQRSRLEFVEKGDKIRIDSVYNPDTIFGLCGEVYILDKVKTIKHKYELAQFQNKKEDDKDGYRKRNN